MKTVKLNQSIMIEDKHYREGDVVLLSDVRAGHIVSSGGGEIFDGDSGSVANPDTNPLADAIDPKPPVVQVVNPADALAPKIADNPGLVDLVTATHKEGEVPHSGTAAGMSPHPTGPDEGDKFETATKKTGAARNAANLAGKTEAKAPTPAEVKPAPAPAAEVK